MKQSGDERQRSKNNRMATTVMEWREKVRRVSFTLAHAMAHEQLANRKNQALVTGTVRVLKYLYLSWKPHTVFYKSWIRVVACVPERTPMTVNKDDVLPLLTFSQHGLKARQTENRKQDICCIVPGARVLILETRVYSSTGLYRYDLFPLFLLTSFPTIRSINKTFASAFTTNPHPLDQNRRISI